MKVGNLVVLLLFFYIDAVVLLVGAEIDSEIHYISFNAAEGSTDFTGEPWQHLKQKTVAAGSSERIENRG